ncbi:MAG TPA: penicillin-binding protein [Candidatus Dormibacteraeota bacterium]|jgi:cell division protein FtsI (penicillin-binding protein 3)|nr:penicillin-binding protein [Candidatus Dormibacteraeota bacterium]
MRENRVQLRLLIVAGCMVLWVAAVFVRLGFLQLVEHSYYLTRAHRQQQRTVEITPKRGAIFDRNMHPLAMSTEVESAYAIPTELADNKEQAARLLSGVLDIPREILAAKFDSGNTFVWVSRKLPPEKSDAVKALNLKGIYTMKENERFYPNRDLAAHVLGFVNLDEKGTSGLEFQLDKQIRGKGDRILVMADAKQRWFDGEQAKRDEGANVVLTLDTKIQYIAERELAAAIARTHAMAGTVIIQNPNTGEILALANWPNFNPNSPGEVKPETRMNSAVSGIYEPGSTFKLITLAAALDQNLTRPDEVFDCENGAVILSGHKIHDHKKFGMLTVSDILALSSDVGTIKIALRLGAPKFYEYIRAFGFGQQTGIELPWESRGMVGKLDTWSGISIGAISMGQEVGVTPIQLVTAVSAIANGGMLRKPYLVSEVRKGDQLLYSGDVARPEPRQVLRPETAATVRKLMEGVILSPGGTGKYARLDGWTAAGKTGTAQKIDPNTKRYSPTQFIASFTGFAPINNPAVTILVSLDSPVGLHEATVTAAPVFKRIAEQVLPYLDVPRDVPVTAKLVQASYKDIEEAPDTSLNDFNPINLEEQPKSEALPKKEPAPPSVTVALDEGGDIAVPDFHGKTVREVTETCLRLGLNPVLIGSSLAQDQSPAVGAKVRRGAKITVRFDAAPPKGNATHTLNRAKTRN